MAVDAYLRHPIFFGVHYAFGGESRTKVYERISDRFPELTGGDIERARNMAFDIVAAGQRLERTQGSRSLGTLGIPELTSNGRYTVEMVATFEGPDGITFRTFRGDWTGAKTVSGALRELEAMARAAERSDTIKGTGGSGEFRYSGQFTLKSWQG